MKKYYLLLSLSFLLCGATAFAQEDASQLRDNANAFMLQGDYSNAILLLTKAQQLNPKDLQIAKDLAMNYYLNGDNEKARTVIDPTLDRDDADDQCYQIAGNIYQALSLPDDCEKLYKKGLKKFPTSGPLYNDYGELLWERHDYSAIDQWEKGIQIDPSCSKNYYNACKYYYLTADNVWCIIYGETFVDMEPLNAEGPELKNLILESYKKLFSGIAIPKANTGKSKFEDAFIETMNKQSDVSMAGISTETITMIRTRFILDWFKNYADKFPFRLFELQRQLLQSGMFDAYDQWLFESVQNLATYQNWANTHTEEFSAFDHFQKGRIFKIPAGQYYK